jgi:hypothetical protein
MARRDKDPFVKMPVWWARAAAKAINSPALIVLVELLRRHYERNRSLTFPLPNGRLLRAGVSRDVKRRVLRDLERAKLISVERPPNKTPIVTLTII